MSSIPTWNSYQDPEVAETALAAVQVPGVMLTFSPGNNNKVATTKLSLCTHVNDPVDAILLSEIVSDADYKDQYNIFQDVDYSYYTRVGENCTVLKGVKNTTMNSLALAPSTILAANVINVTAGGTLYVNGSAVTLTGGTGSGFTGIANVIGGVIQSITVTNPGVYTVVPTTVVVAGAGSGATFTIAALSPAPALAGTELILDASTSKLKVRPTGDSTSPTIAVLINPVLSGAIQTGAVHVL